MNELLTENLAIDTAAPLENRLPWDKIPAKMAVYLLSTENEGVLLATVGNLRAALQRRLADSPTDQKTKKIEYGKVCTHVHYRIVNSAFVANYYYLQCAQTLFPHRVKELVSWRSGWWIGITPDEKFPRFRRTQEVTASNQSEKSQEIFYGPIPERTAAGKLVETLEDLFDLCRYYEILKQAPHGKACAYKEMGKCPAPCDGSISMEDYHRQIDEAMAILTCEGFAAWQQNIHTQMRTAAAALEFERAAKLKAKLERGNYLNSEAFRLLRPHSRFSFLGLLPGKGKPWIEPVLIHGSDIHILEQINRKQLPEAVESLFKQMQTLQNSPPTTFDPMRMGLLNHHLFRGDDDAGIYQRAETIHSAEDILAAAEKLTKKRTPKPMVEQSSESETSNSEEKPS